MGFNSAFKGLKKEYSYTSTPLRANVVCSSVNCTVCSYCFMVSFTIHQHTNFRQLLTVSRASIASIT